MVAAGSLLGVAVHAGVSFPVGKVDMLELHPMNFREFLEAMGEAGLSELLAEKKYSLIDDFRGKIYILVEKLLLCGRNAGNCPVF